jgi:hypothetical protein
MKLQHSPVPPAVGRLKVGAGVDSPGPTCPVAVLAATILYVTFRPLDHWPAPLVKAYCDDCFGARKWVDTKECQLLVQNLALVHAPDADTHLVCPPSVTAVADQVASAYRGMLDERACFSLERSSSIESSQRRTSLSSNGTSSISKRPRPISHRDSSDEALESVMDETGDGGDDSSSGEEDHEDDHEVLVAINGDSSKLDSEPGSTIFEPTLYPLQKGRLNFDNVRQRYFGSNRLFAHDLVAQSLSGRLDVKSKQNSGLLQTLIMFTTIPQVRQLVAENLERWLQSPAVSRPSRALC